MSCNLRYVLDSYALETEGEYFHRSTNRQNCVFACVLTKKKKRKGKKRKEKKRKERPVARTAVDAAKRRKEKPVARTAVDFRRPGFETKICHSRSLTKVCLPYETVESRTKFFV